jgi:hypothetical protein
VDRACGSCPGRKDCKDRADAAALPAALLRQPLIRTDDVPVACKKRNRLMLELRRSQDQYRSLQAERDRHQEYRGAVIQQYRFLAEFLEDLADQLPSGINRPRRGFSRRWQCVLPERSWPMGIAACGLPGPGANIICCCAMEWVPA